MHLVSFTVEIFKTHFNIMHPSTPRSSKWPLSFIFPHPKLYQTKALFYPEDEGSKSASPPRYTELQSWWTLPLESQVVHENVELQFNIIKVKTAETRSKTQTVKITIRTSFLWDMTLGTGRAVLPKCCRPCPKTNLRHLSPCIWRNHVCSKRR